MISKSWRIKIFNWLGAGRLRLIDDTEDYKTMSNYVIGGGASAGQNWVGGGITLTDPNVESQHNFKNTITIKVTPANGGHIVSVSSNGNHNELHIIPEDSDFDRELGKIITLNRLKS